VKRERDPSVSTDKAVDADDAELGQVLEAYLADLEAGRPDQRELLLAAHPAIARQLRACLQVLNLADRMVDASHSALTAVRHVAHVESATIPPGQNVLTTLGSGSSPPPRVHLRDLPDEPEPLIKPRSAEMPAHYGASLGRYQLLGEIARGGMGVVLKGRDVDLGRDLALKVLLDAHQGDPDVVSRFIEEAQIGGQLQHPGIAPVYELGTFPEPDRRPFFAMKLVKGQTLAASLHERKNPAHDMSRFLAIFEAVCQTIAYAHARGVIHRDLKPSNVMVGSFGEVQVMDWGLAKVMPHGGIADEAAAQPVQETVIMTVRSGSASSASQSQPGSVLGTPAYMAPEQARGEQLRIDERADVFGLGAILCEILTGHPPFAGSTREAIRAQAARGDIADAWSRLDVSGAETELIGLARDCLAAEPEHRPRNAGEVARRLTAHLAGVQERLRAAELARVEAQARAAEERKRRRLTVSLAASVLITVAAVGGGWAYLAWHWRERAARLTRALAEVEVLRTQAERAGDNLALWRSTRDAAQAVERLLADAPDGPDGRRASDLARKVTRSAAAAENDQKLLDRLVEVRSARADDADGSTPLVDYEDAFRDAGIDVASLSPAQAAARILARPAAVRVAFAAALDDWAAVTRGAGGDKAAGQRLTEAARLSDPDPWRNRLRQVLDAPANPQRLSNLKDLATSARLETLPAASVHLLGTTLVNLGDPAGGAAILREGQRLHPGDVMLNFALAQSLQRLRRRDEAIRYYVAARSLRPEMAHDLAHSLQEKGETELAIAAFQDVARLRPKEGRHLACLGIALRSRGRSLEGKSAFEAAIAACRAAIRLKPARPDLHHDLGIALMQLGNHSEAITAFRESLRLKPDSPQVLNSLGNVLKEQGRLDVAISEYRAALRLKPDFAMAHNNTGDALRHKGALEEAIAEHREALRLEPDDVRTHNNLGLALRERGKLDEAVAQFRIALTLNPEYAIAHNNLGSSLRLQGKLDEAIAEYREALRVNPEFSGAHNNLGVAVEEQGKLDEAIAQYRCAVRLKPEDSTGAAAAHTNLGRALLRQGNLAESLAELRNALRFEPDYPDAHVNLGLFLRSQGSFAEAIAAFRKARELVKNDDGLAQNCERELTATERASSLAPRLAAVLAGKLKPRDAAEAIGFAQLCYEKKLHGASARFWAEAFQSQPKLAEDMQAHYRCSAVCAAALAASGQGKDDPPLNQETRSHWRKQAIEWFKINLVACSELLAAQPQVRQFALQELRNWKSDSDLAGLRDAKMLAKLPGDEQSACRALWVEVDALLAKSRGASPKPSRPSGSHNGES
jgi:serine/threonine-protein kinase